MTGSHFHTVPICFCCSTYQTGWCAGGVYAWWQICLRRGEMCSLKSHLPHLLSRHMCGRADEQMNTVCWFESASLPHLPHDCPASLLNNAISPQTSPLQATLTRPNILAMCSTVSWQQGLSSLLLSSPLLSSPLLSSPPLSSPPLSSLLLSPLAISLLKKT